MATFAGGKIECFAGPTELGASDNLEEVIIEFIGGSRKTLFMSKVNRPVRYLMTFSKDSKRIEESSIVMYNEGGSYHDQYVVLMRDFLTIF